MRVDKPQSTNATLVHPTVQVETKILFQNGGEWQSGRHGIITQNVLHRLHGIATDSLHAVFRVVRSTEMRHFDAKNHVVYPYSAGLTAVESAVETTLGAEIVEVGCGFRFSNAKFVQEGLFVLLFAAETSGRTLGGCQEGSLYGLVCFHAIVIITARLELEFTVNGRVHGGSL